MDTVTYTVSFPSEVSTLSSANPAGHIISCTGKKLYGPRGINSFRQTSSGGCSRSLSG